MLRSVVKGNCRNLIENLLKNDPVERLPMKPGGVKNLREHKWFAEHDWDALTSQVEAWNRSNRDPGGGETGEFENFPSHQKD